MNILNREVPLFNELLNGQKTSVNIGAPDGEHFQSEMKQLIDFIYGSVPVLINNIRRRLKLSLNEQLDMKNKGRRD